jgi:hypothetical protein
MDLRIQNAVGLFKALPYWFFQFPGSVDPITAVMYIGQISLVAGIFLMIWHRRWELLVFLIPVAICQALVAIAGFLRGQLSGEITSPIQSAVLLLQLLIIGYLVYRSRGMRLAATFLGLFCVAYSLFAVFVAGMSFRDTWL